MHSKQRLFILYDTTLVRIQTNTVVKPCIYNYRKVSILLTPSEINGDRITAELCLLPPHSSVKLRRRAVHNIYQALSTT